MPLSLELFLRRYMYTHTHTLASPPAHPPLLEGKRDLGTRLHTHMHNCTIPSLIPAHLPPFHPLSLIPSHKVSRQLVHSASRLIQRELPNIKIDVSEVQETPATAFGNSSGIM